MQHESPKIDPRKSSDILKFLKGMVPHYTPEWKVAGEKDPGLVPHPIPESVDTDEKDSGIALLRIFSRISEIVINRFNQVPKKNFVAFLDMLGIKLLPAQPARVPVTFKLAKGTENGILIPARTQAAAEKTNEHEELPFETEKDLWATPSQLVRVVSIDPSNDAIYEPPPGFLNGGQKKQNQITYTMTSNPQKGEKKFQLDHATDLKEAELLKIHRADSSPEYVVIAGISGNIITITEALSAPYSTGTSVEKVTQFNLFEGKNVQEHGLYIGEKDLLNMKSTGEITLEFTPAPGTEGVSSGLNLIWEYWGENKENKEEGWIPLQVKTDGTNGFRNRGEITLSKIVEGEIKEEKLGDIFKKGLQRELKQESKNKDSAEMKSRWIRCKLQDKLTNTLSINVPKIDTIFIKTKPGESIPPDAGFFNDVPLDWTKVHAKVVQVSASVSSSFSSAMVQPPLPIYVYVDSVEEFKENDEVSILRGEKIIAEDIEIVTIDPCNKTMALKTNLLPQEGDVIQSNKIYPVYPFGKQPKLYDTFYIGSKEAFSKKEAKITLTLSLNNSDTSDGLSPPPDPKLSWEYWNGKGWQALTIVTDDTDRLLESGDNKKFVFYCPKDIEETDVNGQKNYWIRAKIVGGDYGRDEYVIKEIPHDRTPNDLWDKEFRTSFEPKYNLPIISDLKIEYEYSFETMNELQCCLTYNNLVLQDVTLHAKTKGQFFKPFITLEEKRRSIYLGFDKSLSSGPIRIFFAANELSYTENKKPKLEWAYRGKDIWKELDFLDATEGLIKREILEFLIEVADFSGHVLFGDYRYWMRGSLTEGEYEAFPLLDGIYPNTTWAIQSATVKNEILGSGDGKRYQSFTFSKFPVREGQEIRVRENLLDEERQELIREFGENAIHEVKDETGKVTETWVLWKEVTDLFDSKGKDRHYTLDHATGQILFGDGVFGMIPSPGESNIMAFSYQWGGGKQGNVKAGEIKSLKSAVGGVDSVSNPIAADGGADTATPDQMLMIGPAMISHRERAVTAEDFEWLAKAASRKVVKARCLPNKNNQGKGETGWVTVIIVPDSKEEEPKPTLELRKIVSQYLEAHCANTISSFRHVHVSEPSYKEISVSVDLLITSMDVAPQVERDARKKLNKFFHPLTGGPEGNGWEFGRDVSVSDIYALLEDIDGLDHIENLKLSYDNETTDKDVVEIREDCLVANGTHIITFKLVESDRELITSASVH